VTEFNRVDGTFRADNVGNVRDSGTGGGTKVQDLFARSNADIINTTQDGSGDCELEWMGE
jgi:hypothetical protein